MGPGRERNNENSAFQVIILVSTIPSYILLLTSMSCFPLCRVYAHIQLSWIFAAFDAMGRSGMEISAFMSWLFAKTLNALWSTNFVCKST